MARKAVIYTRVSTEEQKENGFSLQEQEARLKRYCQREDIEVVAHYQDDHSAKNFNRPAFQKMLTDLKEKRVTANLFLCIRMDRFSRNLQESLKMIQVLAKLGLEFKVVEGGNFDLDTPENLIPFILNMLLPQVENERRGLNTKRGMRQAQREGRWTGTAPNGYRWYRENDKSLLTPNVKAKLVRLAFEEFAKGIFTSEEIRRKLVKKGLKCSRSQFSRLLRNPVYIGQIKIERWKDEPEEIVIGLHEPLINEELFNEVQSILEGRIKKSKVRSSRDEKLPLRGFLQCRICGGNLTGSASRSRTGARHFYYHCQKGCRERFRADEANGQFVSFLGGFKIPDEVLTLYYHVMEDVFK
ncbi:MAG: recombinase family protein, partial [Bacteroidetes bacterium]|nr:recombinase family protein [Bacteroidota bacterium]